MSGMVFGINGKNEESVNSDINGEVRVKHYFENCPPGLIEAILRNQSTTLNQSMSDLKSLIHDAVKESVAEEVRSYLSNEILASIARKIKTGEELTTIEEKFILTNN